MVHELLVLELLLTLLEKPSDSSIEVAVSLAKEVGAFLQDVAPAPANQCAFPSTAQMCSPPAFAQNHPEGWTPSCRVLALVPAHRRASARPDHHVLIFSASGASCACAWP